MKIDNLTGTNKTQIIKFSTYTKYFSYLHEYANYYPIILLFIFNILLIFLDINSIYLLIFF